MRRVGLPHRPSAHGLQVVNFSCVCRCDTVITPRLSTCGASWPFEPLGRGFVNKSARFFERRLAVEERRRQRLLSRAS